MSEIAVDEDGPFPFSPPKLDYIESEYQRGFIDGAKVARQMTLDELEPLTLEQAVKIGEWKRAAKILGLNAELPGEHADA